MATEIVKVDWEVQSVDVGSDRWWCRFYRENEAQARTQLDHARRFWPEQGHRLVKVTTVETREVVP